MRELCITVPAKNAQIAKKVVKGLNSWDGTRRLMPIAGEDKVAIPITTQQYESQKLLELVREKISLFGDNLILIAELELPAAKKLLLKTPETLLHEAIVLLFNEKAIELTDELRQEIPGHWEKHGDLVLLPDRAFISDIWSIFGEKLWHTVCSALGYKRVARKSVVSRDGYRTPQVVLLYGDDSWVEHIDNGIRYAYDVRKCMFSPGNVTEKLRVSRFDCNGEVVVDLYAGIGYFTLPYLVYTGVKHLHACEWNPDAVEALKKNLQLNGVEDRCTVHFGDNRKVCPRNVADRVNLGLIPSSEFGWKTACMALNPLTGGILHIHGNVNTKTGYGENMINDGHTICDKETESNHVSDIDTDVSEDRRLRENKHTNKIIDDRHSAINAVIDADTIGCSQSEDQRGLAEAQKEAGINEMDYNTRPVNCQENNETNQAHKSDSTINCSVPTVDSMEMNKHSFDLATDETVETENNKLSPDIRKKSDQKLTTEIEPLDHQEDIISSKWLPWAREVSKEITNILQDISGRDWNTTILHIEHVKSYAPYVDHVVLDLKCYPI